MTENTAIAEAKEKEASSKNRKATKKRGNPTDPSFNMDELRELAELVNEHGFTDFEFENENIRVRLSKVTAPAIVQTVQPAAAPVAVPAVAGASPPAGVESLAATAPAEAEENLHLITSPIVGTFYRSPGPDKESYVKEGSQVMPETVVCIVEAMKLMNEIQAETTGEIAKIYVENGQPVEFGQPLFGIRK